MERVERASPAGPGAGTTAAADLAAAGCAGLTLGSAGLFLPLGRFGVLVTSIALLLGAGSCLLAALVARSRGGRPAPAPAPRPVAAGRQPR